ncbi:MAG: hypothetical protein R3C03_09115 [Pirellulaceae bacterium]
MTLISRKAKVCPQCRMSVSFSSAVAGFIKTGVWLIAAIISLGFAALEKAEKYGYSKELQATVAQLDLANLTTSVLQSQIINPQGPPPQFLENGEFAQSSHEGSGDSSIDSGRAMMAAPTSANDPTELAEEAVRLEQKIQEQLIKSPRNEALLKQLIRRQQYLKTTSGQY